MIVLDTSAAVALLAGRPQPGRLAARVASDPEVHAPHLIDVEVIHALRGLVLGGKLSDDRAQDALADFSDLSIVRYQHLPLTMRMWDLRQNLTAYDAAFVALSEALGAPLITCDRRLGSTGGHQASIEVFAAS